MVSKTNTEDITLTTEDDYKNALNIFQETADKYVDGKYAIKARSVSRTDLDNFAFDEEFWNADIYDGAVAYTNGKIQLTKNSSVNENFYMIPYIIINDVTNAYSYNSGDLYNVSVNGIDEWIVYAPISSQELILVPKVPIKILLSGNSELSENPQNYFDSFYSQFTNYDNVIKAGNLTEGYDYYFSIGNPIVADYYRTENNIYYVLSGNFSKDVYPGYNEVRLDYYTLDFDAVAGSCCDSMSYKVTTPVTKGFRPVVTLKYSDKLVDGKNLSTDLEIGDYVNYKALGYNNWRVLSIDEDNNTVDIISGGIVKNIYLYGENDFENYEDLLQSEVDTYKVGDNVISARPVEYNDIINLNKMKDDVNAKYWSYEKRI